MRRVLIGLLLMGVATSAHAAQSLALFPFELVNTSLEGTRPDEQSRLAMVDEVTRQRFLEAGLVPVDLRPFEAELDGIRSLRSCNCCDRSLAAGLGADFAVVGWVQKVSNLILNINLQVRDVATGKTVAAGSVDIRGNTDESWRRGVEYLLEHRILPQP